MGDYLVEQPATLLDLLNNTLILHHLAPYIPVASRLSLAATNRLYRTILYNAPQTFRHLDLSCARCAVVDIAPIDSGGNSWRAERIDESISEDEFYGGPLRGIFSQLEKLGVLRHVHVMLLDGLSVPADLVQEIISQDRFNVRILSLRGARHLNERKLMQVLKYAVRPSRPEGTPLLRGLYVFGEKDQDSAPAFRGHTPSGIIAAEGAQIGASLTHISHSVLNQSSGICVDQWYQPTGKMVRTSLIQDWADVVQTCSGIIAFDAVLCRGPRHSLERRLAPDYSSANSWLPPSLANVALGPSGCAKCGSSEEGPARFGDSLSSELPLLSPPPLHSSNVRDAQKPLTAAGMVSPPLFARCEDCLRGRWCERCHKSWCSDCYTSPAIGRHSEVGVARDCFDCGRTCHDCKQRYMRECVQCRGEYCIVDNEGSTETCCDWCNLSGRRTRNLYASLVDIPCR